MKTLNRNTIYGKPFSFIVDNEFSIGFYIIKNPESFKVNDKTLLDKYNITYSKFFRIHDGVLIKTFTEHDERIDFLVTEDVCFENLRLVSDLVYEGKFINEFSMAFDMLETNQYEDGIWYG